MLSMKTAVLHDNWFIFFTLSCLAFSILQQWMLLKVDTDCPSCKDIRTIDSTIKESSFWAISSLIIYHSLSQQIINTMVLILNVVAILTSWIKSDNLNFSLAYTTLKNTSISDQVNHVCVAVQVFFVLASASSFLSLPLVPQLSYELSLSVFHQFFLVLMTDGKNLLLMSLSYTVSVIWNEDCTRHESS